MYKQLISTQRSQIYSYRQCGKSVKFIADEIGVHQSTVYRELKRNCNKKGGYAHNANEMALERRERVVKNATIPPKVKFECLQHLMVDQWSPEQISGAMKRKGVSVSHTTIYKWVAEDKAAGGTLFKRLRHNGRRRKSSPYKGASALPMEQLHDFAASADKDIDISAHRVEVKGPYLSAHPVDADAHVAGMPGHYDAVAFIQIKHNFFDAKFAIKNAFRKSAYFGWLLISDGYTKKEDVPILDTPSDIKL